MQEGCLPIIECELNAQRQRTEPDCLGFQSWLFYLPTTVTWNKLLSLSVFNSKMRIKNSIYCANVGFLVFINIPRLSKTIITLEETE